MSDPAAMVLGDVMTDVVCRLDGPIAFGSDTPARIALRPGGSGANTAAWLGSLGIPVRLRGAVGDDMAGREGAASLRATGAEPDLQVVENIATGVCVVLIDRDGERTMLPDAGANDRLSERPLPAVAHVHVSGYALMREGSRPAAVAVLREAAAAGIPSSVDAASAAPLRAVGAAVFRAAATGAATLFATLDEAQVLTGSRDPDHALERLLDDHHEVVLKPGAAGARSAARDGTGAREPAAAPLAPAVDQTGAGDAFAAAWIATRLRGGDATARLRAACALAAVAVTRPGARP